MDLEPIPYDMQIFVCTNDRKGEKPSCGDHQGEEIFKELRRIAKERGLHPRIRVAQAKCLGQCAQGANIMVYGPSGGVWYKQMTLDDVPAFAEKYLTVKP
ncbi:MAG: (2Fe-2S) ferredoxin domain-containing protein [Candidatus Omnitrophota bacterium]|jgi:(2Fe-2S) ferredoxin|nr:(2Fe-2S) ferredoxin domain-containing protein [Candidatus Omnitrophota bacterium]